MRSQIVLSKQLTALEIARSEILGTVPLQPPLQLNPSPIAVFAPKHSGPTKVALYDELCFIEEFLAPEKAQATLIVDRAMDSGSHLLSMLEGLVRIPRNVRRVIAHGLERGALIAARMKNVNQLWRCKQRRGLSGLLA